MAEKPVDQKLKECKTLIIQNVQKNMQGTMIYRYLKDEKIENDIKKYSHNPKDNLIALEFLDHEKALQFYDRANFKDKILIRPFNIYFHVTLSENEMKKYDFDGVNEENLRKMFEIVREIGVCKIYTKYTSNTSSGKVKPQGRLSFIRKNQISENELNDLKEKLSTLGIKINLHVPDKGLKCALILTNFFTGNINDSEEIVESNAKKQATDLINKVVKDKSIITNVTAIVKRRPVASSDNTQGNKNETTVKGLVEFADYDVAVNNFEQIRKGFINIPNAKATLHFYNSEVNTYLSLISNGLLKPEGLTDKQFEDKLVDAFRQINQNVIQVNVFPSANTFVGRVYMKSEEAGRDFIVDYDNKRQLIVKYYKNSNNIRFDMNVDDNTMKKIKMFKKKAGTIMDSIKNQNDKNKHFSKGIHQFPINSFGPMMGGIPNMGLMNQGKPGIGLPQGSFQMGMIPPMGPSNGMGPSPMGSMGPPPMGFPNMQIPGVNPNFNNLQKSNPLSENRAKIDRFMTQRAYLIETTKNDPAFEDNLKKQFFPILKFVIENDLKISPNESGSQANIILQNNDISTILDFMKTPLSQTYAKITVKA